MGFQFNQVGGGTKTRRPVALRMQYNPKCSEPIWFLMGEDGIERSKTLAGIQDYIEKENRRLELDPMRSFDSREINIRMEYKHCPNMILIDTPGLISAPRVPKGLTSGSAALAQQRALQASAREAEKLVVDKMRCEDYIILCVEDTSDWKHGQTREVVQKADPDLTRTVIVNTKFDTKLPQFGNPADVEDFLRAPILDQISPNKLGGPFFTSVPSGRVGRAHDNPEMNDFMYDNDDDFVNTCASAENTDRSVVLQRLKRMEKAAAKKMTSRVGLSHLRKFLEDRVEHCYKQNVQKIVPMLQSDYTSAERRLRACEKDLKSLSTETLKAGADAFVDDFCKCLRKALKGTIVAPVQIFGETLEQEYAKAGSFHGTLSVCLFSLQTSRLELTGVILCLGSCQGGTDVCFRQDMGTLGRI
jgi:phosphosulfolactate phosphohydrolase-like enzyme